MGLWPIRNRRIKALLIEERGTSRIYQLAEVAGSKSVRQKVLELAWTAGPVALIASFVGYYLGNGKMLPTNTLVFFIGHTVITGVVSLVANFVFRKDYFWSRKFFSRSWPCSVKIDSGWYCTP